MRLEQQSQLYHFSLLFQSVKMKVKFPCKLSLQHMGTVITNEVSAKEQNKFLINEEVVIKDQSEKKFVEIIVNLITQKGSKYIAGIIKLFHNELVRSEGQRIVVALGKCLDAEAFCEVKVEKVVTQKVQKRNVMFTGSRVGRQEQEFSPAQNQMNFKSATNLGSGMGTRSQAQFNLNPLKSNNTPKQWQQKKETCALTYYPKTRPSPPRTRRKLNDVSKLKPSSHLKTRQDQQNTNRQKLIQAEVYKQNYIKLKQKYRKQSQNYKLELNKRIALQNNENNYKLEIVRLRLKCEELEKAYNEKNLRLKELQGELIMMQQRDGEIGYYKEEANSLRSNIAMLEDTIITLNTENEKLKELTKERQHEYETKMNALQAQYQKFKQLYQNKECQYQRDMRVLKQQLIQLQYQLNAKTQSLQKQKNYIFEFEKSSQAKLFEFDTLLQNQRNNSRVKYEELKTRFEKMEQENKILLQEKKQLQAEKQSHKSYVMKTQYEYKMHVQQLNSLKNQLQQMHSLKQKHQKLIFQHKTLKEQKQFSTKNFDKLIKNKDLSFEEIVNQNKKQIEFIKKINSDLNEKNKSLIQKNIEYQGLAQTLKNTIQKNRRALQMVTKDFTQLKEKQKGLKKAISEKEQLIDELKDKLQKANVKQSSLLETKRTQTDKMNQIISKLKLDLQSQCSKSAKLTQTTSQLTHEISRLKMMLQFSQQKVQKNSSSAQEKYKSYQAIIQQHQGVISMLQENINEIKIKQNQLFAKYSQLQNEYGFMKDQYEKSLKQNRILSQKLSSLQSLNKQKSSQLSSLLSKHQQSQKRNQSLQNQLHQTKTQLSLTKGQKQKTLKLLQISNQQNQKCRQTIIKFSAELFDKESKIDAKNKELSKIQEELQKANYKAQSLSREYNKFRQGFGEVIGAAVRQLDTLKQETMAIVSNMGNGNQTRGYRSGDNQWESTSRFSPNTYGPFTTTNTPNERTRKFSTQLTSKTFNDITNFTTQIISTFSNYSKQNQSTITRLIERNKLINKQLQEARNGLTQQIAQNQQLQYQAERQKEQIEEELRAITHQKGSESIKLNSLLDEIKQQLQQKQQQLQQAHSQLDQLQFTLSSNKMDYDASINQLSKKNYQLKQFLQQLEEKNQFQHNVITSLQQKCYQLDKQLIDFNNCIMAEKEVSYKREGQILQALKEIKQLEEIIEAEKLEKNKLLQVVSNLQVEVATEKESRGKLQKTLNEEEQKKRQLKEFSANIIKEKQTIIKQQLQQHQKLSELQNKLIENEHHKQLLLEEIQLLKTQLSAQKIQHKKVSQILKDTQAQLSSQKAKITQQQKTLKDKQKSINQLQSSIKQLTKKHQTSINQYKKSIIQLNEQISFMANHKQRLSQDMNQKLLISQKQLRSYQAIITDQKSQLQQLQQHLYAYKQKSRVLQQTLITRQHQINQLRYKTQHLQALKSDLQQDSKDKQQNMYQLSATIYQLQSRIASLIKQKELQIEQVNNQWNVKYQELYQQLEQRFQLLQKEKVYLKEQLVEKEGEINKISEQKKSLQTQYTSSKKLLQDKIKKLQEQRLSLLTTKNNQLHKQSQQLKQLFQSQKKKQAQHRKTSHQLQIARNQILKLDARLIQLDNKIKSMNKLYQQQLQEMKKKELTYKGFRQQVINQQWNTQRELRKTLQAFTKSFLTYTDEARDKGELIQLIKGLETGIVAAVKMFNEKV